MLATVVLDFDHKAYDLLLGFIHEDGFSVQGSGGPIVGSGDAWAETQGTVIHQPNAGASVQMFRLDRGNFRLLSIQLNSFNANQPAQVPFFEYQGKTGTALFTHVTDADLATFQTFESPVTDAVGEVRWMQASTGDVFHQFDNIVVEVGPSVVEISPADAPVRYEPVANFEVTFNEAIDLASFTHEDLTLSRDGSQVALDASVTVTHVSGTTYRIEGLAPFTQALGDYSLTVQALNILSPTGLQGMGSHVQAWTHTVPLTVTATTPSLEDGTAPQGLTSLDLHFSVPAEGADQAEHYELRRAGADGLLGTADDPLVPLTASYNDTTVTLNFAGLVEDVYRLTALESITDAYENALDGDADGTAGGDWTRDFVVGVVTTPLESAGGTVFDLAYGGYGIGQLVNGTGNGFDGANRLIVDGETVSAADEGEANLLNDGQTYLSPSVELSSGLEVQREVTVPASGEYDFARTVDTFSNPTGAAVSTTIRVAGNLGSNGRTTVFGTSSGDAVVDGADQWIGTDDGDGSGTPAVIHYLRGPGGLAPTDVQVVGDNLYWEYNLTIAPGQTVRLAHFTLLAETRQEAEAAAAALVTPGGFGDLAAVHLTPPEVLALANFRFNTPPWAMDDDVSTNENTALLIDLLADNGQGPDGDAEGNLDVSKTIVTIPPTRGTLVNHGNGTLSFDPGPDFDFLAAGQSTTETFTYQVEDALGETATAMVTITVQGINDPATIGGTVAGETDEDSSDPVTGQLLVTDLDTGENLLVPQTGTAGTYGTFSLQADGTWTYGLDNVAVEHLREGESVTETFTVTSADGTASQEVTITIAGVNDAPVAEIVSVSEMRIEGNEIIVTGLAADAEDVAESLIYQYEVLRGGDPLPVAHQSGTDLREFRFTPTEAGAYVVVLTVTDLDGRAVSIPQSITVEAASQVDLIFSKTLATVGTAHQVGDGVGAGGGTGPGPAAWFHEWEDATAELWITLENDLPAAPVDFSFELQVSNAWLAAPQLLEHLGAASWETSQEGEAERTIVELRGIDLTGYQVGDRILVATLIFPQDTTNPAGITLDQYEGHPEPISDHGIALTSGQVIATSQNLKVSPVVPGQFVPVLYDADDNGSVGLNDFILFVSRFGLPADEVTPDAYRFDYDGNHSVGLSDFIYFVQNFGAKKEDPAITLLLPDWLTGTGDESPVETLAARKPEPEPANSSPAEGRPYAPRRLLGQDAAPASTASLRETLVARSGTRASGVSQPIVGVVDDLDPRIVDALWETESYDVLTEDETLTDEDAIDPTWGI